MANDTEGQLVDLWNREEESTGLKGWLEENVSKKGLSKLYNKAAEYQKEKMAEEVIPGLTQGQLYEGISGTIGGGIKEVSRKTAEILKRTKAGKDILDTMNSRIGRYPKDRAYMALAPTQERRVLEALPEEFFENPKLLKDAINKGDEFFNSINEILRNPKAGPEGRYDPNFIKDVMEDLYENLLVRAHPKGKPAIVPKPQVGGQQLPPGSRREY